MPDDEQRFISWHSALAGLSERETAGDDGSSVAPPIAAPFAIDETLNRRLVLLRHSSPWVLRVDSLVVGNNEAVSCRSGLTGDIFRCGGVPFEREVALLGIVRTGEARDTAGGGSIAASRVVHAVGPKYKEQYATAAASSLHACYRSALTLCCEVGHTAAFLPLHDLERKAYPAEEGAHVALRTVRRFMEQRPGALNALLLLAGTDAEFEVYSKVIPLYFPRTAGAHLHVQPSHPVSSSPLSSTPVIW